MLDLATPLPCSSAASLQSSLPDLEFNFGHVQTRLRPLQPGDEAALLAFFRSHTPETIYARYGCSLSGMTPQRAAALVGVDQTRDCALGIFESTLHGEELHAVGRYCLDPNGTAAELAFVVRESMRRLGMATALLKALKSVARQRGLHRLWAQVAVSNDAMVHLFHHHGFTFTPQPGLGITLVSLHLRVPGVPLPHRPPRPRAARLF